MTELTVNQVDVAKLTVSDDEIVMITVASVLTKEAAFRIKAAFKKAFEDTGGNVPPILVIGDQLKVEVVRRSDLVLNSNETLLFTDQPNPSPPRSQAAS